MARGENRRGGQAGLFVAAKLCVIKSASNAMDMIQSTEAVGGEVLRVRYLRG